MKNKVIFLGAGILLASCNMFRSSETQKQISQRDSTIRTDLARTTIDTGSVRTREVTMINFQSPGIDVKKVFPIPIDELITQLTHSFFVLDTAGLHVSVGYDAVKKQLQVAAKKDPEKVDLRTEKETVTKAGKSMAENLKKETKVATKSQDTTTVKKPDYSWMLWLAVIIAMLLLILNLYNRFNIKSLLTRIIK